MYHHDDIEMWHEHRHELLREAEKRRLARRLRAGRPKMAPAIGTALLGFLSARLPQRKGMAKC